jgi:ABC-type glycerol-3-phosphate transport system substrate-binding protein
MASIAFLLAGVLLVWGCGGQTKTEQSESEAQKKTVVTMMYPGRLNAFEALVESTYDDIDLQVEMTTTATINGDSERRLRNGHGTDIIVTTLPSGQVVDYTMDLSAEDFAADYQGTVMKPLLVNGQTHYIPLPGQYAGYVINATLAAQLTDTLPQRRSELIELLDTASAQGVGVGEDGVLFGISNASLEQVGSFLVGLQVPDFLGQMSGIQWVADFQAGNGTFTGTWEGCLDGLQHLVDVGYIGPSAYTSTNTNTIPVEERMESGTMLVCYGNVRLLNTLNAADTAYDYTMLPFLSDEGNQSWVTSAPDGYIALNKTLEETGNEAVLDASLRVLALLSTQEGQQAWLTDTEATISYLLGYENEPQQLPEAIEACVEAGGVYHMQLSSDVVYCLGYNLLQVLCGNQDMTQALAAVDIYCQDGSEQVAYDQSVVGSVADDLLYENYNTRREETAIGNLVADAVAELAGTELAVVNGGGIRASLYKGDVYGADLSAVCPYQNYIVVIQATGDVIWQMLENGISATVRDNSVPGGRFLQVSGLCYAYQPMTEDTPAQLLWVTLADGTPLDLDGVYEIAINDYMAGSSGYLNNNGDGYTMLNLYSEDVPLADGVTLVQETGATYADAMEQYFFRHQDAVITAACEGRITVAAGE